MPVMNPVARLSVSSTLTICGLAFSILVAPAAAERVLVRVAVSGAEATSERLSREIAVRGGMVRHRFSDLGILAVESGPRGAAALAALPGVLAVEEDPVRKLLLLSKTQLAPSAANGLYGLVTSGLAAANKRGFTGQGVLVGVADTALDCGHPDIAPSLVESLNAAGSPDDGSCTGGPGVDPGESHATHVAGTIIAANNKVGVVGGAPGARLLHARVCTGVAPEDRCLTSDVMAGVRAVVERGARVVNLSLGGSRFSGAEEDFYRGLRRDGILVIAAAGNDGADTVSYPAGYQDVVAVGAVDVADQLTSFSNFGTGLDLVAPGSGVLSALPRGSGRDAEVLASKDVFAATGLEFAGLTGRRALAGKLIFCGLGRPADFSAKVRQQIALIQRGELFFSEKVANAMAAGAAGVVIYNNSAGLFSGTLQTPAAPNGAKWIPAVGVSDATGARLRAKRLNKAVSMNNLISDWGLSSGTSMATPHVVAAAAVLWAAAPELDADGVEQRLKDTALDLGEAGFDFTFGAGRIDALRAVLPD
jgi:subtilisin family serine protease